jgi:hypothetical protein
VINYPAGENGIEGSGVTGGGGVVVPELVGVLTALALENWWKLNDAYVIDTAGSTPDYGSFNMDGTTPGALNRYGDLMPGPTSEAGEDSTLFCDGYGGIAILTAASPGGLVGDTVGSLGFWIKLDASFTGGNVYNYATDSAHLRTLDVRLDATGKLSCFVRKGVVGADQGTFETNASAVPLDNTWHFCLLTCDGTNKVWYVDGASVASTFVVNSGAALEGDWLSAVNVGALCNLSIAYRQASAEANNNRLKTAWVYSVFYKGVVLTAGEISGIQSSWSSHPNSVDETDLTFAQWMTKLHPAHRWRLNEAAISSIADTGELNGIYTALSYTATGGGAPVAHATGGPLGAGQSSGYVEFRDGNTDWIKLGTLLRTAVCQSNKGSLLMFTQNNDATPDSNISPFYCCDDPAVDIWQFFSIWSTQELSQFCRVGVADGLTLNTDSNDPLSTTAWNYVGVTGGADVAGSTKLKMYTNGVEFATITSGATGSVNRWLASMSVDSINVAMNARNREGGGAVANIGEGNVSEISMFDMIVPTHIQLLIYQSAQVGV